MSTSSEVITTLKSEDFKVLAGIIAKINTGQKLTDEENKKFKELTGQLDEAKKTVTKKQTEDEKQAEHEKLFAEWFSGYKTKLVECTCTSAKSFIEWQKENIADMPKLAGNRSTGTSFIKPVEGEPSANSYQFYVKKALTDKIGQTLTLAEIGKVVVSGKPETAALNAKGDPRWKVYVHRAATWFPENVTKTGKGDLATFVWNEK